MIVDPAAAQTTVAGWVALALVAIAGVSNVLTKLAALKEQVKTLFKTQEAHASKLQSLDEADKAIALATPAANASASGPVVVEKGQGTSI